MKLARESWTEKKQKATKKGARNNGHKPPATNCTRFSKHIWARNEERQRLPSAHKCNLTLFCLHVVATMKTIFAEWEGCISRGTSRDCSQKSVHHIWDLEFIANSHHHTIHFLQIKHKHESLFRLVSKPEKHWSLEFPLIYHWRLIRKYFKYASLIVLLYMVFSANFNLNLPFKIKKRLGSFWQFPLCSSFLPSSFWVTSASCTKMAEFSLLRFLFALPSATRSFPVFSLPFFLPLKLLVTYSSSHDVKLPTERRIRVLQQMSELWKSKVFTSVWETREKPPRSSQKRKRLSSEAGW